MIQHNWPHHRAPRIDIARGPADIHRAFPGREDQDYDIVGLRL